MSPSNAVNICRILGKCQSQLMCPFFLACSEKTHIVCITWGFMTTPTFLKLYFKYKTFEDLLKCEPGLI